jgi:hypothetical protein
MQSLKELLPKSKDALVEQIVSKHKYVSTEFQDYGYRLAVRLDDVTHASMYIKICKEKPRVFIDQAVSFVSDYPNAKNKVRLFLWKIKQLTDEYNAKNGIVIEKKKRPSKRTTVVESEDSLFQGKRIKLLKKEKIKRPPKQKTAVMTINSSNDQTSLF